MRIPVINGIIADERGDFSNSYPVNRDPVIAYTGISEGYLRAPLGIRQIGTGPGADRGGWEWDGVCYRVMGTSLISVDLAGNVTVLGDVGDGGVCGFDNSFDYLIVNSGNRLYHYSPGSGLTYVTDPDLGIVNDAIFVDGYTMTTDGSYLVVNELADPLSIDPLKYGSAEESPDPITGLVHIHGEVLALNRYTIQIFQNIGGNGFPFQTVKTATIPYGCVGPRAKAVFLGTVAFVGSAKNGAPAVYLAGAGDAEPISTRAIEDALAELSDAALAAVWVESRVEKDEQRLLIHLPTRTWVFYAQATKAAGERIWACYASGLDMSQPYNGRGMVYYQGKWVVGDDTGRIGVLDDTIATRYGESVGWQFDIKLIYNEANRGLLTGIDMAGTPGRGNSDSRIWFSYTKDGETWSMERATSSGKLGERRKRVAWRPGIRFEQWMGLRFRGADESMMAIARLECDIEGWDV